MGVKPIPFDVQARIGEPWGMTTPAQAHPLTVTEFARLGGKARWQGIDSARRSRLMSRVRKGRKTRNAGRQPKAKVR